MSYCISTDADLILNTACLIPQANLILIPYELIMDGPVEVKIAATNAYGTSEFSELGSGAVV